ncbi:MAG: hypothetical protein PV344_01075, partial [Anaplasma sp.]|nr:hypothetical protein [Anaplasma sp.]
NLNTVTEAMERRAARAQRLMGRYLSHEATVEEEMKTLLKQYIDARGRNVERSRIVVELLSIDALDMAMQCLREGYENERGAGSQRESQLLEALDTLAAEKKHQEYLRALDKKNARFKELLEEYINARGKDVERKEILKRLESLEFKEGINIISNLNQEYHNIKIKGKDSKRAELLKEIIDSLKPSINLKKVENLIEMYIVAVVGKDNVLRADIVHNLHRKDSVDLAMRRFSEMRDAATEDQTRE